MCGGDAVTTAYTDFLSGKRAIAPSVGIDVPEADMSPWLFDFQRDLTRWALRKGRAAIFADTGLGKTRMQLERSEEHTSELQSLMRISYAVFCLKKKKHI